MTPGATLILMTLSLCEFAFEATTVRQAFNSRTPANKEDIYKFHKQTTSLVPLIELKNILVILVSIIGRFRKDNVMP